MDYLPVIGVLMARLPRGSRNFLMDVALLDVRRLSHGKDDGDERYGAQALGADKPTIAIKRKEHWRIVESLVDLCT